MKPVHKFYGAIRKGQLALYNQQTFKDHIASLDRQKVYIVVEKLSNTRTIPQNSLYWLYLGVIENETGDDAMTLHEFFKRKFLPPRFVTVLKQEIKLPATTTKLSKLDFSEYMEKICALTGIPIPDTEAFYNK